MQTIYVLVIDPQPEDFQEFKQNLGSFFLQNFREFLHFEFLHARQVSDALSLISQHGGAIALICIDPSIATGKGNSIDFNNLKRVEKIISEAAPTDAEVIYVGDPADVHEAAKVLTRSGDGDRLVSQGDDYLRKILSKMDQVIAKKTSGTQNLNIELVRVKEQLKLLETLGRDRFEGLYKTVESISVRVNRLDNTLYRTSDDATQTPSLIDLIRTLQTQLSSVSQEMDGLLKHIARLQREDESIKKRVKGLEDWQKRISELQGSISKAGARHLNKAIALILGLLAAYIGNLLGLGDWIEWLPGLGDEDEGE